MMKSVSLMIVLVTALWIGGNECARAQMPSRMPSVATPPKLDYIASIVIRAKAPRELAKWYTEQFGLSCTAENQGGFFGSFETSGGLFYFGILPGPENAPEGAPTVAFTFRVVNFDAYLKMLTDRGLKPIEQTSGADGKFAAFLDPEGNMVGIWGT